MADKQQKIVIVGGGMVGVSLALLLSQRLNDDVVEPSKQVSITLIEQYPFPKTNALPEYQPSFDDRSTALSAGSVAILEKMDCWSSLAKSAEPIKRVHVSDRGHFGGVQLDANDYGINAVGYVIENRHLGQALLQQLRKRDVECLAPAKVSHCVPKKQGYSLTLSLPSSADNTTSKRHMNADIVLVADGAESALRGALGIDTDITDYQQSALIANVALAEPHDGVAYERFTDKGPIALLPLPPIDGIYRAALVWTIPSFQHDDYLAKDESALIAQLQQRFGYRAGMIAGIGERHIYPLKLVQAKEQVRSHLVVIGNAAHFLHPVAGQGFNLALRDCRVLVECLQQAQSDNELLGRYSVLNSYLEQQIIDQQLTIGVTDRLVKLFSSQRLPMAVLRQLGFMGLNVLPMAKHQFALQMMGIGQ